MSFRDVLGVVTDEERDGYVRMSLKTNESHGNIHGTVHGAVIFALVDTAFEEVSNQKRRAVALNVNITFKRPVTIGDTLTVEAIEESPGKITSLYHIVVRDSKGLIVAVASALSYSREG